MSHPPADTATSTADAFAAGARAALGSVFLPVLTGTYLGIGALAHDLGFSMPWVLATTIVMWAGPAQVILISALGNGGTAIEAAVAVTLSAVRLLPMVVTLMPLMRRRDTSNWSLLLPAHFTAVNMWVLGLQHLPVVARENRIAFCNGMGAAMLFSASVMTIVGFYLAATLPVLLTAALLFLTPMSFLVSIARNATMLVDRLALVIGLVVAPVLAAKQVELDLLWTGLGGGTVAYLIHRTRRASP